jgi:hypothetical protein
MIWSGPLDDGHPPTAPGLAFARVGDAGNRWTELQGARRVALYEDATLGAMKALWLRDGRVEFMPVFDGSMDRDIRLGSDFAVMEDETCRFLTSATTRNADTWCGPADVWR